jgi:hypothetical protein
MGYPETVVNSDARSAGFWLAARRGVGCRSEGMGELIHAPSVFTQKILCGAG